MQNLTATTHRPAEPIVPPSPSDHIVISGLTKRFGGQLAVKKLDLTVGLGEFLVLLGPSGCGKTTTMRSIAGLESPDEGSIQVGGRTVFDSRRKINVPPHERKVGMVFQSYAIWPHRDVFENVAFPLRMQKVPRAELRRRVEAALDLVGLEGLGKRPASKLSGGQMQRVALARSVVMQPAVLLLDEPLSNLDAKLRDRLRVELKATQQELGTTAVYVTHDQAEALALADRIALMRNGVIEQISTPLELYRNPQSRFAAEFVGTNNVLSGLARPEGRGSSVDLPTSGLTLQSTFQPAGPQAVSICIRAEEVVLDPPGTWAGNLLAGHVEVVNLLGSQVLYAVRTGGVVLEVLSPLSSGLLTRDDRVNLGITTDSVRCFPEEPA